MTALGPASPDTRSEMLFRMIFEKSTAQNIYLASPGKYSRRYRLPIAKNLAKTQVESLAPFSNVSNCCAIAPCGGWQVLVPGITATTLAKSPQTDFRSDIRHHCVVVLPGYCRQGWRQALIVGIRGIDYPAAPWCFPWSGVSPEYRYRVCADFSLMGSGGIDG